MVLADPKARPEPKGTPVPPDLLGLLVLRDYRVQQDRKGQRGHKERPDLRVLLARQVLPGLRAQPEPRVHAERPGPRAATALTALMERPEPQAQAPRPVQPEPRARPGPQVAMVLTARPGPLVCKDPKVSLVRPGPTVPQDLRV
jgi:hypothetical protein